MRARRRPQAQPVRRLSDSAQRRGARGTPPKPDLAFERQAGGIVAGIDEAGRGPLAGPVVAAAVILSQGAVPADLDDSKCLSAAQREDIFASLLATADIGVGAASVAEIDQINVLAATMLAMERATVSLVRRLGHPPDLALIDGNRAPDLVCATRTIVDGDARCASIAAASVIAKVTRDRAMTALAAVHRGYGWDHNFGYATVEHRLALTILGPSPHHRRSFSPLRSGETSDASQKLSLTC